MNRIWLVDHINAWQYDSVAKTHVAAKVRLRSKFSGLKYMQLDDIEQYPFWTCTARRGLRTCVTRYGEGVLAIDYVPNEKFAAGWIGPPWACQNDVCYLSDGTWSSPIVTSGSGAYKELTHYFTHPDELKMLLIL